MSTQVLIVCLVAISAFGRLAQAQEVSSRSATPDEPRIAADSDSSHGGQARNIYSQKLSGHRMMHFGKRPLVPETPSLVSLEQAQPNNQVLDLYPQRAPFAMANAPSVRMMRQQQLGHPIPLIIPPTISEDEVRAAVRKQHLMDIVAELLEISRKNDCVEQERRLNQSRQQQQDSQSDASPATKLMRLIQNEGDGAQSGRLFNIEGKRQRKFEDDDSEEIIDLDRHLANEAVRSQNLVEAKPVSEEQVQEQQERGQDDASINLAGRSVPMSVGGADIPFTRAQISNILYGRQMGRGNSIMGVNKFNKKTEPQKMTFMHFG